MNSRVPPGLLLCLSLASGPEASAQADAATESGGTHPQAQMELVDPFVQLYNSECAVCHGEDLLGAALGTPLVGTELVHGSTVEDLARSIADGFPTSGMPSWSETMNDSQIWNLALYVAEQRQGTTIVDKRRNIPLEIPEGTINSERHDFRVRTIATDLDPLPFSIAALPDGSFLLSEKLRGLSIISPEGEQSELIRGTPRIYGDAQTAWGQLMGVGWMLDVAIHPDFEANGWIYIHYGDRCSDCNAASRKSGQPVSMNKLVRGRIRNGEWVDQQTIWEADIAAYTSQSDIAAGGRTTFDDRGHVFISVGIKAMYDHLGIQDLSMPYGKIHRVKDDGGLPTDNPFVDVPDALPSVWSYGHRSTQGLSFDRERRQLWCTEMGPRGGDELNRIEPGGNYGWPLFTRGVNYDGRPVDYADELGIDLSSEDVVPPVVDMTPSPAISNFVFYYGEDFPNWNGDIIVGTLRATDLMRMQVADNGVVETEVLLEDLARVRDVEVGPAGQLYILLEHASGGRIIQLLPAEPLD